MNRELLEQLLDMQRRAERMVDHAHQQRERAIRVRLEATSRRAARRTASAASSDKQ